MKLVKIKKKKIITGICLMIGICIFVLLNIKTKINLVGFTAKIANNFSSTEEVLGSWGLSASTAGNVTATLYGDGRLVIDGNGTMKSWNSTTIEGQGTWHDLTSVSNIKSIEIKDGVRNIGDWAFKGCSSVTTVKIADSVSEIGIGAFNGCTSLTNINLSNSITKIYSYAFDGCSNITNISLPSSLTSIGFYAFYGCSGLTSIEIPNSVTNIDKRAFTDCNNLVSINVDTNNKSYSSKDGVLFDKEQTKIIRYPLGKKDITEYITTADIGTYAFAGCTGLKNIEIQNGATAIEEYAFENCTGLTNVNIQSEVTNIGKSAFKNCKELTSINMPDSITSIGESAFIGCSSLIHVEIPSGVTSIETYTFYSCTELASIKIPNGVTSIGYNAIHGCSSLTNIDIPSSVTDIEDSFIGCINLTNINVNADNANYSSVDGILFDKEQTKILRYPSGKKDITEYNISTSVTSIKSYAFYECIFLRKINISNSVKYIKNNTFEGCTNLTNINIPNSIENIESYAFYKCSSLEEINIPSNVKRIYSYAFCGCTALRNIDIPSNMEYIKDGVFDKSKLTLEVEKTELQEVMPEILKRALNQSDILYAEKEFGLVNCEWNNEKNALQINDTPANIEIKDGVLGGLVVEINLKEISDSDTIAPVINNILGNATEWTNQDITLTINATDSESGIATTNGYSFDNGVTWQTENTKTYTENTTGIIIQVKDNVGNIATYEETINIDKIDKIAPNITISPNGENVSQNKNIIITVSDTGGSALSNDNSYQYQLGISNTVEPTGTWQDYTSGTEFTIGQGLTGDYYLWVKVVTDNAGNKSTETDYMVSDKFTFDNTVEQDTTSPTIDSVTGNTENWTNQDIILTVNATDNESGIATTNGYSFDNGETWQTENIKTYTENTNGIIIKVKDNAGNIATYEETINIDKIDKTVPAVEVTYSTTEKTNQNVTATITTNEEIQRVEGWTLSENKVSLTKEYSENTTEEITIKDLAGNETKVNITIANIDHTLPDIKKGDINGDETIDTTDLLKILRHIAASKSEATAQKYSTWILTGSSLQAADINGDEKVDTTDTLKILRHMAASKSEETANKYPDWTIQ